MASPIATNKVGFKVGTQTALNSIISGNSAIPGVFYLTNDTHRLYVGNSDGSISTVNEGILKVASTQALPTASANTVGHFYYVEDINALVIGSGKNEGGVLSYAFMQINAQSPDTTISSNVFTGVNDSDSNASYVIITDTISDTGGGQYAGKIIIKGDNGLTVAMDSATTIGTDSIPTVKISADPLSLTTSTGTGAHTGEVDITLGSTSGTTSETVTLKPGNNVTLSEDDNVITITSANDTVSSVDISPKSTTEGSETTYQNGFVMTVNNSGGSQATEDFDPTVQVGVGTTSQIHFLNGNAILPVYTATEIDNIMRGLNAMTYRGIIGSDTGAVATGLNSTTSYPMNGSTVLTVKIGDTFMVGTEGNVTYNGVVLEPYSLIIARGTEDSSTGNITSGLTWDYIKDTKTINTTYELGWKDPVNSVATPSITLKDNTGATTGETTFTGGAAIDVTATQTAATSAGTHNTETITITHENITRTDIQPNTAGQNNANVVAETAAEHTTGTNAQLAGNQVTIPVIVAVNSDSQGHLTGIKTQNYVLQDTNARVSSVAYGTTSVYTPTGTTKLVGVIQNSVSDKDSSGATPATKTGKMTLSSDTLTIAATNDLKEANGVGNNLNGLSIDLVWGTF